MTPGPPHLPPEPDESSEETAVKEDSTASLNLSDVRAEIVGIIQRVQHQINLDQVAFNNLTYQDLHNIDQIHS